MKTKFLKLLAAALCLALLFGCAANQPDAGDTESPDTPVTENTDKTDPGTGDENATPPAPLSSELTTDELAEWTAYFNTMEHNGLLRFPCSDPAANPDQLAPYLVWLFYDIGDPESEFSDEELAMLAEAGLWLELDAHRLSRDFLNDYLYQHFNISAARTENLLDAAKLGEYLVMYDAWYMSHGDTEYSFYEIDRGERYEDGTIKLYYFKNFLRVAQENGEMDYVNKNMVVTLVPRGDGTWYITSNEPA